MYTAADIEVFILTHDRADMLRETLDCYLNQTVQGFRLVILSNAASPSVKSVAQTYRSKGVDSVHFEETLGVYGNAKKAQELASRLIMVVAHDDDLIHPAYIETLLKAYNKYPDAALVVSAMGNSFDDSGPKEPHTRACILNGKKDFAAYVYTGRSFTFSSCSYKTEYVKKTDGPHPEVFGKVSDVPYMTNASCDQTAIALQFPFVTYRLHEGQDCQTWSTGPTARQWINIALFYRSIFGDRLNNKYGRLFLLQSYRYIRVGWRDWTLCEHRNMTFKQFLNMALKDGATTRLSVWLGRIFRGKLGRFLRDLDLHFKTEHL